MIKRDMWVTTLTAVFFILVAYGLFFMNTPYIIQKPGTAEDVGPMVQVNNADVAEGSVLMLTTVHQMYPNWFMYVVAHFNSKWEIYVEKDLRPKGETRADYNERQAIVMLSSQSNALQAAYKAAEIPYALDYKGVVINRVIQGMPAAGVLKVGDVIVEFEGKTITRSEEVFNWVEGKKVGDKVKIGYEREGELLYTDLIIGDYSLLPNEKGEVKKGLEEQPGLGISPVDLAEIRAEDQNRQVSIDVKDIGGPSAGLIFTMEIYDQLTPGDLTKSYRIAGTGTISPDGTVGPIGGIKHKVIAADREDAEIFFVPDENLKDAIARAEQLDIDMKIIPVTTIQDALDYLHDIPIITE
ncbi:MAG: SepM family pheromone-processing serine protease [Paenibacillaceae bacterium]